MDVKEEIINLLIRIERGFEQNYGELYARDLTDIIRKELRIVEQAVRMYFGMPDVDEQQLDHIDEETINSFETTDELLDYVYYSYFKSSSKHPSYDIGDLILQALKGLYDTIYG